MTPGSIVVIFIYGLIGAFFIARGIKGLILGKMKVHNPLAFIAPTSPGDAIMYFIQKRAAEDYPVPEGFINRGQYIEVKRRNLIVRAGLNILLGLVVLFAMATMLDPDLFDLTMDFLIRIVAN